MMVFIMLFFFFPFTFSNFHPSSCIIGSYNSLSVLISLFDFSSYPFSIPSPLSITFSLPLSQSIYLSLSLSLSPSHTNKHSHTRTYTYPIRTDTEESPGMDELHAPPENLYKVISGVFNEFWQMEYEEAVVNAFLARIDKRNCADYGLTDFAPESCSLPVIQVSTNNCY